MAILTLKPHLSLIALVAFIIWKEGRALAWAVATAGVLNVLATLVLGPDIWLAFMAGNVPFFETITTKQDTLIEPMRQPTNGQDEPCPAQIYVLC